MNRIAVAAALGIMLVSCSNPTRRSSTTPPQGHQVAIPSRPRPTVDPRSSEAAEDLVRGFILLLNQGRFGDAYMLLGPKAADRAGFERDWRSYSDLKVESGTPGPQDGAAGSIYVSVPLTISGKVKGSEVRRSARAVLRRTNDVPGSSEAQRHWHIERIDAVNDR